MSFHWAKLVHENLLSSFNDLFDQLKPSYKEAKKEETPNNINEVPSKLEDKASNNSSEKNPESLSSKDIQTNDKQMEKNSNDEVVQAKDKHDSNVSSGNEHENELNVDASKAFPTNDDLHIDEFPSIDEAFIEKLQDIIGEELSSLLKSTDDAYKIRVKNIDEQISAVDFDFDKLRDLYETSSFSQKRAIMFLFASPFHIISHIQDDYKKELFQDMFDVYFFMKLPRLILPFDELFSNFSLYDCLTNPFILDTQLMELNPDEISDDKCEDTLLEISGMI